MIDCIEKSLLTKRILQIINIMPTLTIVVIKIISFKIGKVAELLSLSIGLMKDILGRKVY